MEAAVIGAIDIGGTKIAAGVVDAGGRVLTRTEWPTNADAREALSRMGVFLLGCGFKLEGIGVGCTGPVDPATGVVGDVDLLPGWSGFGLVEHLTALTGLPVAMENDADAAALAEANWGVGAGARRFLYVTISTGIGAGIVLDGELYRGVDGSHPELGHQTIDASGPRCYCGATGCWESLASGPALEAWMRTNGAPAGLSAREICDLARSGDPLAVRATSRQAEYLGIGLANLVTVFCPDVIALGGGVMESASLLLEAAREEVRKRCGLVPFEKVTIVPASLGRDVALLGAARVWQTRFQESGVKIDAS